MNALYIVLGITAIMFLLLIMPLGIRIIYNGNWNVVAYYGLLRLTVIPIKVKTKVSKQRKTKKEKKSSAVKTKPEKENKRSLIKQMFEGNDFDDAVDMLSSLAGIVSKLTVRVLRAIIVDRLYAGVTVSSEDAAETALLYGKICAAVFSAAGIIESAVRVRRRRVTVTPDFLGDQCETAIDIRIHAVTGRLLWAGITFGLGFIKINMAKPAEQK